MCLRPVRLFYAVCRRDVGRIRGRVAVARASVCSRPNPHSHSSDAAQKYAEIFRHADVPDATQVKRPSVRMAGGWGGYKREGRPDCPPLPQRISLTSGEDAGVREQLHQLLGAGIFDPRPADMNLSETLQCPQILR